MSFKEKEDGFECTAVTKKLCYIQKESIVKVFSYTQDLVTYDELRLGVETVHGVTYHFSEVESGWPELLNWMQVWAALDSNWMEQSYPEPFSKKVVVLWSINT